MEYPRNEIEKAKSRDSWDCSSTIIDLVQCLAKKKDYILDFGSGCPAGNKKALLNDGYVNVFGHDFHYTDNPPYGNFSIVYMKNVLNNLPSELFIYLTLLEAAGYLNPNGRLIVDYPKKNRMLKVSNMRMRAFLEFTFNQVFTLTSDEKNQWPVWIARVDVNHNEEEA